jgi:hypothetical protein
MKYNISDNSVGFADIPVGALFIYEGDASKYDLKPYRKVSENRAECNGGSWEHPPFFPRAEYRIVTPPPSISLDRQYRTHDGREVRLLMVNGGGDEPIIGAIKNDDEWEAVSWCANGRYLGDEEYCYDLIEVKPEITGWVNVYQEPDPRIPGKSDTVAYPGGGCHRTRESADIGARLAQQLGQTRIACLQITFREGDGL